MTAPFALTRNPNELGDRDAMGLPPTLVTRLEPAAVARAVRRLRELTPQKLVEVLESLTAAIAERYAAGTLLALAGDPRIDPFDPVMVDVPGDVVRLGLSTEEVERVVERWRPVGVIREWIEKETPEYDIRLAEFRIARFPVTNHEYRVFATESGTLWLPTSWTFGTYPLELANHPVWTVPAEAADAYAAWLSARTGRRFRLCTEAEWEYAAGGGDGREYPWGATFEADRANTVEHGPLRTSPVGSFPAGRSPFGVDDMAGNVEEYVADEYAPYPGGPVVDDDLRRETGGYRVARGGSFTRFGDLARCRRRHGRYGKAIYAMGFRLAETP